MQTAVSQHSTHRAVAAGSDALSESQQNYFHHHKLIPISVLSSITWEKITHHHPHCPLSPAEDPLRALPPWAKTKSPYPVSHLFPCKGMAMPITSEKKSLLLPLSWSGRGVAHSQPLPSLLHHQTSWQPLGHRYTYCTIIRLQHQIHVLQELPDVSEEHLEIVGMHGLPQVLEEICVLNVLPWQAHRHG